MSFYKKIAGYLERRNKHTEAIFSYLCTRQNLDLFTQGKDEPRITQAKKVRAV